MGLMKLALIGGVGYGLYRYFTGKQGVAEPAAFSSGEHEPANFTQVRSAGPEGMRSDPPEWDQTDQASDESYPASDPPAANRFP